ncbi:MAG TPA: CPBP family intramembrane glutamic endopeptidase [Thermoanaerobaculia bacterium]|nr:CPBP family intramembrane glutamic endopeptidase [Thermoanaerobaculia bacterium]
MTVLQRLSPRAELVLINLICFGPFAAMSILGLMRRETILLYDDRRLYTIAAIELVCGTLAILILRARGWKLRGFGLRFSMPQTIAGMLLYIGATIVISGFNRLVTLLTDFNAAALTTPVASATWPAVLLLLAIDPIYEETFEVAYNVRAAERNGAPFAITLSAVIRLVCHAYQGPIAPLTILPLGIIFAFVYWKWRRVWPLAVAHGAAGFFALAPQGG